MKYAILVVFNYLPDLYGVSKISPIQGSANDLVMMTTFCIEKEIPLNNITIITDLVQTPSCCEGTNIKFCEYPSCLFLCRELSQFVENTIRGIEEGYGKGIDYVPEVLIYISCHGSEIPISIPEKRREQGLVLTDETGSYLRYLTTKDIFNMLFGRIHISPSGLMKIPVYRKIKTMRTINDNGIKKHIEEIESEPEFICIQLSEPIPSPETNSQQKSYRSSYNSNRGIPYFSKVLIIADTCHSGHMTHFPFIFSDTSQALERTDFINSYVRHIDMPFCVCISSCKFDKVTKSPHKGSQLTRIIHSQFRKCKTPLNFMQFYYHMVNLPESVFREFIVKETWTPVISSTQNETTTLLPFFGCSIIERPRKIKKTLTVLN